ncbi:EamA family transporter [Pseudonocardia alaniniphila]|uniref:EamA family transporter n=1 Tax=Pseudonocardia alaniniphila TaxID=75291 RepID=UPI003642BE4E
MFRSTSLLPAVTQQLKDGVGHRWSLRPAHDVQWADLVYLAIGPTAVAYLFYYRGLRSVTPVTATISMFAVPVLGAISSSASPLPRSRPSAC